MLWNPYHYLLVVVDTCPDINHLIILLILQSPVSLDYILIQSSLNIHLYPLYVFLSPLHTRPIESPPASLAVLNSSIIDRSSVSLTTGLCCVLLYLKV